MRWLTYRTESGPRSGILEGNRILGAGQGISPLGLLVEGVDLCEAGERVKRNPSEILTVGEVTLEAPIPRPPSVRDFLAFEQHALNARRSRGLEFDPDWYKQPSFYFSNPAAICGPTARIPMAPGTSQWDYELEVAAVVGRQGSDMRPDAAEAAIAGYCILCDFSARDLQKAERKLGLGFAKSKDTATSLGPCLVTPDELASRRNVHGFDLAMKASVNGVLYSSGMMSDMYWSFGEMLSYASRGTTLIPGDVVGSGTVGTGCILELAGLHGPEEYPWLQVGDRLRLEVEYLGVLEHEIVAPAFPLPHPLR